MAPKSTTKKPTRRSTRAASLAKSPEPSAHQEPANRASEEETQNGTARGEQVYEEPRGPQPTGLFPMHDGSYGMNTLVAQDDSRLRRNRKSKPQFAKEDEEDTIFMQEVLGPKGTNKTRVNSSGVQLAHTDNMREVSAQSLVDEARELDTVEEESHEPFEDGQAPRGPLQPNNAPIEQPFGLAGFSIIANQRQLNESHKFPTRPGLQTSLGIPRPPLKANNPPFRGDIWDNSQDKGARNLYKVSLSNPNVTPYNQRRHPSEPPTSLSSKYGVPAERSSSVPSSPLRPDTSRSFNHESLLFGDATVRTPQPLPGIQPLPANITKPHQQEPPPMGSPYTGSPGLRGDSTHRLIPPLETRPSPEPLVNNVDDLPEEERQSVNALRERMHTPNSDRVSNRPDQRATNIAQLKGSEKQVEGLRRRIRRDGGSSGGLGETFAGVEKAAAEERRANTSRDGAKNNILGSNAQQNDPSHLLKGVSPPCRPISPPCRPASPPRRPVSPPRGPVDPPRGPVSTPNGPVSSPRRRVSPPRARSADRQQSGQDDDPAWTWGFLIKLFCIGTLAIFLLTSSVLYVSDDLNNTDGFGSETWIPKSHGSFNLKDNLRQFIPASFTRPSTSLTVGDSKSIWQRLRKHDGDIQYLRDLTTEHEKKIGGIKTELPPVIHLTRDKNGKPKVPDDFWFALRDLMVADEQVLTLKRANTASPEVSQKHWEAMKHRLQEDGSLNFPSDGKGNSSTASLSRREVESIVNENLTKNWGAWITQNSNEISKALGTSKAGKASGMSEKEMKTHIDKVIKAESRGTFVTRTEFVDLVQEELVNSKGEYSKQLRDFDVRLKEYSQELAKLREAPPSGWSRAELDRIVEAAVRKARDNAKLEAAANTGIRKELAILETQVNFFGQGSGAVVDPTYTSPMWSPPQKHHKSLEWYRRDGYKPLSSRSALEPWLGMEGECFCAGPHRRGFGVGTNNVSILLSRDITPRHLVVEHILPGATLDPDATPRDIEVWASYDEVNLRSTVQGWSDGQWPLAARLETTLPSNFVKIGHFLYNRKYTGDGIEAWKFDVQLVHMKAATNHVIVRAVNNYGADHTCFYRLRMFGDEEEVVIDR